MTVAGEGVAGAPIMVTPQRLNVTSAPPQSAGGRGVAAPPILLRTAVNTRSRRSMRTSGWLWSVAL